MSSHQDLGRTLEEHAGTIGPDEHPISLDDVKVRARGIRRRRYAATGLAAAAVLAVAVPAGVVVANHATTRSDLPPADQTPTPNQTVSPSPTDDPSQDASGVTVVALDNDTDARSDEPAIDYLVDGQLVSTLDGATTIRLPNGDEASATRHYDTLVRAGEAWLALWRDEQGRSFVDLVKRGGVVFDTRRTTNTLAASQDGSIGVYGTPQGQVLSFSATDDGLGVNSPDPAVTADPVAVLGSGTCKEAEPEGGGCTVFYNDVGARPGAHYATSHGITDVVAVPATDGRAAQPLRAVGGVSKDGWVDGTVSVDDFGSCSVMLDQDLAEQWRTCDYTLGKFSPDGTYVLGHPAYRDGIGDSSVAILDARTGEVLVDYRNDEETQAFVNNAVWETDGTVLATVYSRGSWSLMRLTADGDLSLVDGLESLGTNTDAVPLVLATGP